MCYVHYIKISAIILAYTVLWYVYVTDTIYTDTSNRCLSVNLSHKLQENGKNQYSAGGEHDLTAIMWGDPKKSGIREMGTKNQEPEIWVPLNTVLLYNLKDDT